MRKRARGVTAVTKRHSDPGGQHVDLSLIRPSEDISMSDPITRLNESRLAGITSRRHNASAAMGPEPRRTSH